MIVIQLMISSLTLLPSVWFYLSPYSDYKHSNYQHHLIALAEGLQEQNVFFKSNINYWPSGKQFLFQETKKSPYSFDIVVTSWLNVNKDINEVFKNNNNSRPFRILVDWKLGQPDTKWWRQVLKLFDLTYRSHYSSGNVPITNKIKIGGFHWTNRMKEALETADIFEKHRNTLLFPHGKVAMQHTVRRKVKIYLHKYLPLNKIKFMKISKHLEKSIYYNLTGGRHDMNYYTLLKQSWLCDASGGYFYKKRKFIYQWESFKLAEIFLSGCTVIMPDLNTYHNMLSVPPKPFVHYIPYLFDEDVFEKIKHINLSRIGQNGRDWALKHYSPKAFSTKFIFDWNLNHID